MEFFRIHVTYAGKTGKPVGLFGACHHLKRAGKLTSDEAKLFEEIDEWCTRRLPWSPKVKPRKLRLVYQTYAEGIIDEERIDDLGYALYARCRDIWCVSDGRCQECTGKLSTVKIGSYSCYECEGCGWTIRKRRWRSSYERKRLIGGSAYPAFLRFLREFERARDPHARMLAIDTLVHAFHGDYEAHRSRLRRTACQSVLDGSNEELMSTLDELAYGENADPQMLKTRATWLAKLREKRRAGEAWKRDSE